MSTGLRELLDSELEEALERVLAPRLSALLQARRPGHCARTTEIGASLAVRLCRRVRSAVGDSAQVHVLGRPPQVPGDVAVTSTKLIELRNPEGEEQRPPLLVFVPPGTRASAEDSFDVATFEEVALGDVYGDLAERLLAELPEELRRGVADLLGYLGDEGWPYADASARARFLLTVQLNDFDPMAAGAAVFELGLVPDFDLFADPAQIRTRAARNLQQMRVLVRADRPERQRVIELGLTEPGFRAKLAALLAQTGVDSPRSWTRRIVVDRANWGLAFQRWPLREDTPTEKIRITVGELELPRVGEQQGGELGNYVGQKYLRSGSGAPTVLNVPFTVDPDPRRVAGLTRFVVQLVAEEAGPTGVAATVRPSRTGKTGYTAKLRKLRNADLDPGWHYVRVVPQDDEGIPLPVEQSYDEGDRLNESERFYVVADDDIDEPPERPRVVKDIGLTQALRRMQFKALEERGDWRGVRCHEVAWKKEHGPGERVVQASFGGYGQVEITLPEALVGFEQRILAEPEQVRAWRLAVKVDQVEDLDGKNTSWPVGGGETLDRFLAARVAVFAAISGDDGLVVEGRDLSQIRELAQEYAESYGELLNRLLYRAERADDGQVPGILHDLTLLLRLDCATVEYVDLRGDRRELTLVAPTHPLRLLWLVTWAELGRGWLMDADGLDASTIAAAGRSLAEMAPLGFPLVVPRIGGALTLAAADLTPYWGICLPAETDDPRGVIGSLTAALGLPERWTGGASAVRLADRVERYLRLHPYVGTLVISAVNPGRGEHLADMLIELQRRKGLKHISYDLRLFTADPERPDTGEALARLLRGEWGSHAEAETFHTRTRPGQVPKLAVAVRPLAEFRSAAGEHATHITMLFDAFSGERFDAVPAVREGLAPVHGLQQDVTVRYDREEDPVAWRKSPRHGRSHPIPGAAELSDLLAALPETISVAASAVTTRQVGTRSVPRVTLSLDVADSTLLHQAHLSSDWVITVDRTLGVEYFDNPGSARRPDYVIDADTVGGEGLGHHLVISSRSVDELRTLLEPVLAQHGFQVEPHHTASFFDQLRLLSGQLAFKLASAAATQRTEVLGLVLARLYLDYQGVLTDQILVPLDAHLELLREARRRADEVGEAVGLQRTDLALFSLDARSRVITCRLVEVKCYSSLSAYEPLKDKIATQLRRSEQRLAEQFDPHRTQPDRPDRVLRNAELVALLRPYLSRAERYRTMRPDAVAEARWLLNCLDRGYRLEFTRTGLVFDLGGTGTGMETEGGVQYHRIGRDLAEELIAAIPTNIPSLDDLTAGSLSDLSLTLPRLNEAAFRAPDRVHEVPAEGPPPEPEDDDEPESPVAVEEAAPVDVAEETRTPEEPERSDDAEEPGRLGAEQDAPASASSGPVQADPITSPADDVPQQEKPVDRSAESAPPPDVYLGVAKASPQYGILGDAMGRRVALDLNETHTISLFGVQGGGKSYTLGSIIEAASLPAPPVNELPRPLATIVFHYSPTLDYAPEFTSMVVPNDDVDQARQLRERYGVEPGALGDVVMLVPEDQLEQRRAEYPRIQVLPLKFASSELRAEHWRFLMGAIGNQSTYIRQLQRIMKAHRRNLRLDVIRQAVEDSSLSDNLKQLAQQRLELAAEYIDDDMEVKPLVRPGRMIIVDLRDEFIEKDDALGLFVVLMQLFAEAQDDGRRFNKLVVFDEAHKYIESPDLVDGLVESVREMRHKGMSVLVASQDPPSVPISLIELSNHVILHKFTSPAWLKHLQKAKTALADLNSAKLAALTAGEAYIWSGTATDVAFTQSAVKVRLRPRITRHGGGTRTAVE